MKQVYLLASGDLRESANQTCWPAQAAMEDALRMALSNAGAESIRAHAFNPDRGHGFIASQREGMDVFRDMSPDAAIIVAQSAWQYSHHVLPGLIHHNGPILTVANWSGQWPGLVGMLNLNGSLTKAGVPYATIWSEDFTDDFFLDGLRTWLQTDALQHQVNHVRDDFEVPNYLVNVAQGLAEKIRRDKLILGVFDEGCMGMFNAIIPDHLLHPTGVFKERLSQSALYYETTQVSEYEGRDVLEWLEARGMQFEFGEDEATELTRNQVVWQGRMYVAAVRMADKFCCDAIGIQYQQGLKDLLPASDLVEGLLNNSDRPPILDTEGREIKPGQPIIHFNEVDECSGLDALLTNRVQAALGLPAHHVNGFAGSVGYRQPPMYFRLGGSTLAGVAKPGSIVWSRIFIEGDALHMDIGTGQALALSKRETQRRLDATTPQWPIMHAQLDGIDRDKFMARHKANHVNVVYANNAKSALDAALCRAALARALGIKVHLCGI
jgi:hypothetical protein